ncbi:hypothetical protein RIR_jg21923.t1 [Rhizophagus irregularis DAOM 181602=DAOM 197198]|nr:hypothetical protein RIR_jg21923.t1 [Rhizophagus irregularis DAOM 181602=DAOM 197198]
MYMEEATNGKLLIAIIDGLVVAFTDSIIYRNTEALNASETIFKQKVLDHIKEGRFNTCHKENIKNIYQPLYRKSVVIDSMMELLFRQKIF